MTLYRIILEIIVDLNEKCKKLFANYKRQSYSFVPSYIFVAHIVEKEIGVITFTAIPGTLTDNPFNGLKLPYKYLCFFFSALKPLDNLTSPFLHSFLT